MAARRPFPKGRRKRGRNPTSPLPELRLLHPRFCRSRQSEPRADALHVIAHDAAGRSDKLRFPAAALEGRGDANEIAIVTADLEGVRTQRQGLRVNPILPGAVDTSLYWEMNAGAGTGGVHDQPVRAEMRRGPGGPISTVLLLRRLRRCLSLRGPLEATRFGIEPSGTVVS